MQRLEVSGVVRLIYRSLGVKGLTEQVDMEDFLQSSALQCHMHNLTLSGACRYFPLLRVVHRADLIIF